MTIFTNCAFSHFRIMLLVERWFFLSCSKWHSAISTYFCKYVVIFIVVSAGHVVRLLFSTALISVDVLGLRNALCRYAITSYMLPSHIT